MNNGFPVQGETLEMSGQDVVSTDSLCIFSPANVVQTSLRSHTTSLPYSVGYIFISCDWHQWIPILMFAFNLYQYILTFMLFFCFADDGGEAMSGPSPGRSEVGAPCTGNFLFLPSSHFLSLPYPFADSRFLRARREERRDVWYPKGPGSC